MAQLVVQISDSGSTIEPLLKALSEEVIPAITSEWKFTAGTFNNDAGVEISFKVNLNATPSASVPQTPVSVSSPNSLGFPV